MGALIKGVGDWRRITWLPNGDETLIGRELTGTLRHFTDTEGTGNHADWAKGDIRNKWVRISATFEHWIKVTDLAKWIEDGVAVIDQ